MVKNKFVLIGGVVVLVLAALGGGLFFGGFFDSEPTPEELAAAEAEEMMEKDPIYLELKPFVVNFAGSTRYLKASMQAMAREQDVIDKLDANMPAIRNSLILLLSNQDFEQLSSLEGKEELRTQFVASINEQLKMTEEDGVEAVYITDFIMQ